MFTTLTGTPDAIAAGASLTKPGVLIHERSTDATQVDSSYLLTPGQVFDVSVATYYNGWKGLEVEVILEWGYAGTRKRALMQGGPAVQGGGTASADLPRRILA
jgi:hypothetical protein